MKAAVRMTTSRAFPLDLPGVTVAWLAHVNDCSPSTIRRARSAEQDLDNSAFEFLSKLTVEQALDMARLRPARGHLPHWSRMAVSEFAKRGASYAELMALFGVGRSTVYRCLHGRSTAYHPLSGRRQLSTSQLAPVHLGNFGPAEAAK